MSLALLDLFGNNHWQHSNSQETLCIVSKGPSQSSKVSICCYILFGLLICSSRFSCKWCLWYCFVWKCLSKWYRCFMLLALHIMCIRDVYIHYGTQGIFVHFFNTTDTDMVSHFVEYIDGNMNRCHMIYTLRPNTYLHLWTVSSLDHVRACFSNSSKPTAEKWRFNVYFHIWK